MSMETRLVALATRLRTEFNKWTSSKGAANGIAPLNAQILVPEAHLPRYVRHTVQTVSSLPINFANGLIVNFDIAANVTAVPANFQNPVIGDFHVIILRNNSGANRTFTLPNATNGHKSNVSGVSLNNNQRRKMVAMYDGTVWDWTVDAAKTL